MAAGVVRGFLFAQLQDMQQEGQCVRDLIWGLIEELLRPVVTLNLH